MTKPHISFTLATGEDIPIILKMMEAFYAIDHYPFDRVLNEHNLQAFIPNEHLGRLWLVRADSTVIGYLVLAYGFSFEYKGRDAFLDEFYLEEAFRSHGIGKKAIDFMIGQAPLLGVKAIHMEVERHNEKAMKLYGGKGFSSKSRDLLTRYI